MSIRKWMACLCVILVLIFGVDSLINSSGVMKQVLKSLKTILLFSERKAVARGAREGEKNQSAFNFWVCNTHIQGARIVASRRYAQFNAVYSSALPSCLCVTTRTSATDDGKKVWCKWNKSVVNLVCVIIKLKGTEKRLVKSLQKMYFAQ